MPLPLGEVRRRRCTFPRGQCRQLKKKSCLYYGTDFGTMGVKSPAEAPTCTANQISARIPLPTRLAASHLLPGRRYFPEASALTVDDVVHGTLRRLLRPGSESSGKTVPVSSVCFGGCARVGFLFGKPQISQFPLRRSTSERENYYAPILPPLPECGM